MQNALVFLACLTTEELSLTPGTMWVTVLSPPGREQKAGWDQAALVPPPSKGEGSSTGPHSLSPHRSYGKSQSTALSAPVQPSWVRHRLYLCATAAAPRPRCFHRSPSTAITPTTPPVDAMEGAQRGGDHWHQNQHPAGHQPPLCARSPSERSQGLWPPDHSRTHGSHVTEWGGVPPPLVSILTWLYTHFLVIQAAVSKLDTISITTAASKGPFKATTFAGFHCKIGQCQMSVAEPKSVNVQMK